MDKASSFDLVLITTPTTSGSSNNSPMAANTFQMLPSLQLIQIKRRTNSSHILVSNPSSPFLTFFIQQPPFGKLYNNVSRYK
jgi:hypothetical protein